MGFTARHYDIPVVAVAGPHIDAGAAALQLCRVDARVFQGVPGGFQQEPLPGIHHTGLDRPNPEKPGVELVHVLKKGSAPGRGVSFAGISGDAVPGTRVPASVGDQVPRVLEKTPESREIGSIGKATRHAHDRDRIVVGLRHGLGCRLRCRFRLSRRSARLAVLDEFSDQMGGERGDVRIVENEGIGCRVNTGKRAVEPVAQLHRHQRIHAQVEEPHRGRGRRWQTQDGLDFALQEGHQEVLALGRGCFPCTRQQVPRGTVSVGVDFTGRREQVFHEGRALVHGVLEDGPVHGHHHRMGNILAHQPVEGLQPLRRCEPATAECRPLSVDPIPLFRRFANLRPGPPCDGLSRQPERPAVTGQLVQKRVRGGMVGLPRIAHDADAAGKEHEHVQVAVPGCKMQVPGAEDLGP